MGADWDGLHYVLAVLRELTLQWWINSSIDPFDLGSRWVVDLNYAGTMRTLGQADNGEPSAWFSATSTKRPLGWETVVDEGCWREFGQNLLSNKKLENATTAFLDALSNYMLRMDMECIYQLCVALEIMESKIRSAHGSPTKAYARKLLNKSILWLQVDKALLEKMFSDRGHIAHGRLPPHYNSDNSIILEYLDLTKRYYTRFLEMAKTIGWGAISEIR